MLSGLLLKIIITVSYFSILLCSYISISHNYKMKKFINYNGSICEEGQAFLPTADHSYRYGDGLFETMKLVKGNILFKDLHFERLYFGIKNFKVQCSGSFYKTKN